MLVLSRRRNESIIVGDDVEIIIVDVRGDNVRLGITAPKEIPVHRREIYEAARRGDPTEEERRKQIKRLLTASTPDEKRRIPEGLKAGRQLRKQIENVNQGMEL